MIELNPVVFELAAGAPWLAPARQQLARALKTGRLPHAILITGQPGVGKVALADWIARFALCDRPGEGPCGQCPSCKLHSAGNHPDLRRVGLLEEKKQIQVEDVRELISDLLMSSYRNGRKVAIVDPADALNRSGSNALLKTLEEPTGHALLILVASRPDRLPATVASRCHRLAIRRPDSATALGWLSALEATIAWPGLLALAAGGPVAAYELARHGVVDFDTKMAGFADRLSRPGTDVVGLAEECKTDLPAQRLRWIENWVTDRIRKGLLASAPGHSPRNPGLPSAARTRHIQGLYATLDELRAAQTALRGSPNLDLLWERVLGGLARELVAARAAQPR